MLHKLLKHLMHTCSTNNTKTSASKQLCVLPILRWIKYANRGKKTSFTPKIPLKEKKTPGLGLFDNLLLSVDTKCNINWVLCAIQMHTNYANKRYTCFSYVFCVFQVSALEATKTKHVQAQDIHR